MTEAPTHSHITATVYIIIDGKTEGYMPKTKLFLVSPTKARIVKDGRNVELRDGKWIYEPKKE